MKQFIPIVITSVLFIACGAPTPPEVGFSSKEIVINNTLLNDKYSFVPQDRFLRQTSWMYSLELSKENNNLIKNDMVVKTFLLAHNADRMIIIGYEYLIKEYKEYFQANGVVADIYLQPIIEDIENSNKVKILFFHRNL